MQRTSMQHASRQEATIPGTGIYAGRLYTEEERAEIKRQNCLTHGQRVQEAQENESIGCGISMFVFALPFVLGFIVSIAEFALLH